MTANRSTFGWPLSQVRISSRRGFFGMSGRTSINGMPQCLALKMPAGSYRQVDDKTTFALVRQVAGSALEVSDPRCRESFGDSECPHNSGHRQYPEI